MRVMMKMLSLALALCLVLSCAAVAFAVETPALSVKILSVPQIQAGASIADAQVEYEISQGFSAETVWYVWGAEQDAEFGGDEAYIPAEGVFDANSVYYLELKLTALEGYALPEEFAYESLANPDYLAYGTEYDDDGNVLCHTIDLGIHTLTTVIDAVEVNFSQVAVGGAPGVESVKLYSGETELPAGCAELSSAWFSLLDDCEEMSGVFEADKVYQVQAELRASAGYSFSDYTLVYIDGEEASCFGYPTYQEISKEYSLRESVHSYVISGMPAFEAGVEFRDGLALESEYENCELYVYWLDEEWNEVEEDAFVAGKTYLLQIEAYSSGYELFAEDFAFIIDGESYQPEELTENQAILNLTVSVSQPPAPGTPVTGDPFLPLVWVVLAVLSLTGAAVLVKTKW